MATELMGTALLFAFRFVSLRTRCFVVPQPLLAAFYVTFSGCESSDKGNRKIPDHANYL